MTTVPSDIRLDSTVRKELYKNDVISINTIFFDKLVKELKISNEDTVNIVVRMHY